MCLLQNVLQLVGQLLLLACRETLCNMYQLDMAGKIIHRDIFFLYQLIFILVLDTDNINEAITPAELKDPLSHTMQ